jgi:hypothetical protein
LRATPSQVAIAIKALLETADRRRIRMRLIEGANRGGAIGGRFRTFVPWRHPFPPRASKRLAKAEPRRDGGFDRRSDSDYPNDHFR